MADTLLDQMGRFERFLADKAYDAKATRDRVATMGAGAVIPPRRTPQPIIDALAASPHPDIRRAAASSPKLTAETLNALIRDSVAGLQPRPAEFARWLTRHLSETAGNTPGGVRLATVHKVKGLEWPHVIVYDASEGLMPHSLAEDPEEERRVFHVAITRCSESVTVICGEDPSPYPAEARSRTPRAPARSPEAPLGGDRRGSGPGQRPSAPAPAPDGEQQTHPGTNWPVLSGRKKPK